MMQIGPARFTSLTSGIWRLEWDPQERFRDGPTLTCWERPDGLALTVREERGWTILDNGCTQLAYQADGRPFHPGNISLRWMHRNKRARWHPGLQDSGNLGGPRRTLDAFHGRCLFDKDQGGLVPQAEEPGLLSKNGWTVVDDSRQPEWREQNGRLWPHAQEQDTYKDLYVLTHDRDYKKALAEAAQVFGHQPLPPRWTLGLWISRWWAYTDEEIIQMVEEYRQHDCPLDVAVLDMEWHTEGWGGYDWDTQFFPDHPDTLHQLHQRGVQIAANLHPAGGVGKDQSRFHAMCTATGTSQKKDKVAFDCTNTAFMDAYFSELHHPHEQAGIDLWWMDWQQGTKSAIPGLDPLPMLNHCHWHDQTDRAHKPSDPRPLIFSRYGGIGSGRYPIGFSGDTESSWRTLQYLIPFTTQSANALYGWWSHDVGGFFESPWEGKLTPELYLRWVQFAQFSPVMRTHAGRIAHADRRFWLWGEPHGSLMKKHLRRRYEMAAWLYSEHAQASQTGVSAIHAPYIDYPDHQEAYQAADRQMHIGDDLIVAPVTETGETGSGLAQQSVWLPPHACWYDCARGGFFDLGEGCDEKQNHKGKKLVSRWLLNEVPCFAKAGSLIPGYIGASNLQRGCEAQMCCQVIPGNVGNERSYTLYEDDGSSQGYQHGKSVSFTFYHKQTATRTQLRIDAQAERYPAMLRKRTMTWQCLGAVTPRSVSYDGKTLAPIDPAATTQTGYYMDPEEKHLCIRVPWHTEKGCAITITWRKGLTPRDTAFLTGVLNRCQQAFVLLRACMHPFMRPAAGLAQTANRGARWPERWADELQALPQALAKQRRAITTAQKSITDKKRKDQQELALKAAALLYREAAALLPH